MDVIYGQIRGARGVLRWSQQKLAQESGLGLSTIARIEIQPGIVKCKQANMNKIMEVFGSAGISLVHTDMGFGVIWGDNRTQLNLFE